MAKPRSFNRLDSFLTLLRTHFCSPSGLPATSSLSISSIAAAMAGYFSSVRGLPGIGLRSFLSDLP